MKKETSWIKKPKKKPTTNKSQKKDWISNLTTDKKYTEREPNVSVFTKTTNPKVVIKAENLKNDHNNPWCKIRNKHNMLMFFCLIIICVIILATFFLSLQTYNTVNRLAEYIIL